MRKHFEGAGWSCLSTMTQNGTRMHKLRPLKLKFLWGRTPRPPCKKMYYLGVILQTYMLPRKFHVACFFRTKPILIPEYLHYVNNYFCRVYSSYPNEDPQCHLFPPKWPKMYTKWPKIGQKWPKILWPKMGFPAGRPVYISKMTLDNDSKLG